MNKRPSGLPLSRWRPFKELLTFWPLMLSGLAILLAVLALLQFRWTNEATAAAEMRIGAELESLMMKWHGDLYGEFSAVCIAMQVGPDSGARDTWNDYLERYVEWKGAAPHESFPNIYRNPELVQNVYIWDTNLDAQPQLFRLNAEKKKIEATAVSGNLQILLTRLRAHSGSFSTSLRVWKLPAQGGNTSADLASGSSWPAATANTGWLFDENVPAIVHPIFQRDGRSLNSQSPVDWMIVVLDVDALRKRILPDLAMRYFGGLEGLDYKVAVVTKGVDPHVIYSSDSGFGTPEIEKADASLNIFGPSHDSVNDLAHQPANRRLLQSTEWRNFYGSTWFPVIEYESSSTPWFLILQHRFDPLQDVIQRVRHKNLAVSAVLLLLLALNIALLTIAAMRAQKFNKLQMDFVASVSHELRTPLTAIFSAAENIHDGVIRDKSALVDYGSLVMGKSRQLMDYVDRILLFASIRSGKDRYNFRPLQVPEILEQVRKNVASLILEESRVIEEDIQPSLPCVVGDLRAVCGCLENLITNAIKYSGADRRIRISARLETTESGKEVAIAIHDRGMGIHSSELKHIFQPFYRSPEATLAQIPGTGLGLSVCKHLAESMGGRLSVKSEPGMGSTFTLHLRTADPGEPELAMAGSRAAQEDRS